MSKGTCARCGRPHCSINGDGTVRYHLTEDPQHQEGNGSRKCLGVGALPAEAQQAVTDEAEAQGVDIWTDGQGNYRCRACERPYPLTVNGRIRSHLSTEQPGSDGRQPACPGSSDFPLGVEDDEPEPTHRDWQGETHPGLKVRCDRPTCCDRCNTDTHQCPDCGDTVPHGTVACAPCDRRVTANDLPPGETDDGRPCTHPDGFTAYDVEDDDGEGDIFRCPLCGELEPVSEAADTVSDTTPEPVRLLPNVPGQPENVLRFSDGRTVTCCHDGAPCFRCQTPREQWPKAWEPGAIQLVIGEGSEEPCDSEPTRSASPSEPRTSPPSDQPTGPTGTMAGTSAGASSASVSPSTAPKPGSSSTSTASSGGSGTEPGSTTPTEDDWRTPGDLLDKMPENVRNILNAGPVCGVCGHEITPAVDQFDLYGDPVDIVWICRNWQNSYRTTCHHTCQPSCVPHLEFAVLIPGDEFRHRNSWMEVLENALGDQSIRARVVSKGPFMGKEGTLRYAEGDRTEVRKRESWWTAPAPDHDATRQPTRSPQPTDRRSRPSSPESAPQASSAGRTGPSTSEHSSSISAVENSPTPSVLSGCDDVTTEAFDNGSTPAVKEFDSYGRYILPDPTGQRKAAQRYTRCTTFAKSISDTFALSMWSQRMVVKGLMLREDLRAMAVGLHERDDKDRLNRIAEDAKSAAGNKVSANLGTAIHGFTEDVDNGKPLEDVPADYLPMVVAYQKALEAQGLRILPGMIERKTVVPQYGVAGKFDRVYLVTETITVTLPSKKVAVLKPGDLVIGDVKGLALTERIPTPDGWTTMGDVRVGDTVFDAYGKPCKVTLKSEVKKIGTYVVRFDDGSSVVCDREHIWWTAEGNRPGVPTAKGIEEIISTLSSSQGRKHHRVPVAGALELPEADLPIDPYLLGCWLGDGARRGGTIAKGRDLFEILENDGHRLGVEQTEKGDCVTRTVLGLRTALKNADLIHNKHIPAQYLRASVDQRTALLRGLMDTDGSWNTARLTAAFSTCDKALAVQVEELLLSLGQRPHLSCVNRTGFGLTVESYTVEFTPVDVQPFRLPRKAGQAAASNRSVTRSRRRVIVAVEPGPDVETACIGVDSPTHTYLCGDRMIPTHNTGRDLDYGWGEISIQMTVYAHGINEVGVFNDATRQWEKVDGRVREDVGIVLHMPVQRTGGDPLCTLYGLDLEEGWKATELCHAVREWRKNRKLAVALEVVEPGPEDVTDSTLVPAPEREVVMVDELKAAEKDDAVTVRPPTWEERFRAVTTKEEASAVFQDARRNLQKLGGPAELNRLVGIAKAKLRSLVEPGG